LSRPSSLPLEKNLILIAALEGRLIFRDNSLPPEEDPSFFQGLSLPPLKRREPRDRGARAIGKIAGEVREMSFAQAVKKYSRRRKRIQTLTFLLL